MLFLSTAPALPACSTARINQFKNFAQAEVTYSEAADVIMGEAGSLTIDESSDTLTLTRDQLTQEKREAEIIRKNTSDKQFLQVLADIRLHNLLLRDYFVALGALAESDAPTQIGKSAGALYASLAQLHPAIENATINGQPVKNFIGPVVELTIAQVQQAALEKELKEHAQAIERELDLQHAAMTAISEGMKARLEAVLNSQESTKVVLPYVDIQNPPQKPLKNKLPKNWAKDRREVLTAQASIHSAMAAADAAQKLKMAFETLVKNEFGPADLQLLLQDINKILMLIEMLKHDKQDT